METKYWINVEKSDINLSKSLQKNSTDPTTIKILPLGNSITFDKRTRINDFRDDRDRTGYRFPLYELLNNIGINFEFIGSENSGGNFLPFGYDGNAGFPGIIDSQLVELLETGILNMGQYGILDTVTNMPYLEVYTPDIILLHIGTNGNEKPNGTNPKDVEDILDEIDRVELLLGKSIKVFLARIINRSPNQNYVTLLNNNVENMILDRMNNPLNDAYPDNVSIVDMENGASMIYIISPDDFVNGVPGVSGDMHDHLHPNNSGFSKMSSKLFSSIISYLGDYPQNMISYWSFDEQSTIIYNDKLLINDASCIDCPNSIQGMNDNSIFFNGSNELEISNSITLSNNLSGDFSVECWVQTNQTGTENKVLIGNYNGDVAWWLGFSSVDGLAKFSVRSKSSPSDRILVTGTSVINDGDWHHIVGIKDYYNSNVKIYVDGVLENQLPSNFINLLHGDTIVTIGSYGGDFFFNGALDEMAVYEKALVSTEILSNYNKGLRGIDYITDTESNIFVNAYLEANYSLGTMNTNLNAQTFIPFKHPFSAWPWNYNGAEKVSFLPSNQIVDWVSVSLRSETNKESETGRRAGISSL